MRQDRGISVDAQRLEQLGWMLFLKIMDNKDQELEVTKGDYISVIPEKFQWMSISFKLSHPKTACFKSKLFREALTIVRLILARK